MTNVTDPLLEAHHPEKDPLTTVDTVPAREPARTAVDDPVDLDHLPDRNLDKHELRAVARDIASRPELWRHHTAFSDDARHYVSLHRDLHVDIWLLCWTSTNDTGWHDHDISSGAVAVAEGALVEHNLAIGRPSLETVVPAGTAFGFGPDHIHRLTGFEPASVSIHAYSPPLWRMGQYAVSSGGVLSRASLSYADELRPADGVG